MEKSAIEVSCLQVWDASYVPVSSYKSRKIGGNAEFLHANHFACFVHWRFHVTFNQAKLKSEPSINGTPGLLPDSPEPLGTWETCIIWILSSFSVFLEEHL